MKFDFVIGNPPYQEDIENNARDLTLYNLFMEESYKIGNCVELITKSGFLFRVGSTPAKWEEKMLNDEHFHVLEYRENAAEIFPNTIIKSGVVITIWNINKKYKPIKIFTRYRELGDIVEKLLENCDQNKRFETLVSSQGLYRFSDLAIEEHPEILKITGKGTGYKITSKLFNLASNVFIKSDGELTDDYVKILGVASDERSRKYKYIKRDYLQLNKNIDGYNVAFPQANGNGIFGEILTLPEIINANECTTDTFLNIGNFKTKIEAINTVKYIKTKFFRALLYVYKSTQNTPKIAWSLIPIQDFTPKSDIDWSQSIAKIDQQLYWKYHLSDADIKFIETNVQEME